MAKAQRRLGVLFLAPATFKIIKLKKIWHAACCNNQVESYRLGAACMIRYKWELDANALCSVK